MDHLTNLSMRGSLFVKPDVSKTFDISTTNQQQNHHRQQLLTIFRSKPINNDNDIATARIDRRLTLVDFYPKRDSMNNVNNSQNSNSLRDISNSSSSSSNNNSPRNNNSDTLNQYHDMMGATYSNLNLSIPPQQLESIIEKTLLRSPSSSSSTTLSTSSTPTATVSSDIQLDIYGYEVDKVYDVVEISKTKSNILQHFHYSHDPNSSSIHRVRLFGYKGGWIGGYGPHGKGNLRFCFPKTTNNDDDTITTSTNDEEDKICISIRATFDHGNYFAERVPLSLISTEGVIDSSFLNLSCNNSNSSNSNSLDNSNNSTKTPLSSSTSSIPFTNSSSSSSGSSAKGTSTSATTPQSSTTSSKSNSTSTTSDKSNELYMRCCVNALTGIVKMVAFTSHQNISNIKLRDKETIIDTTFLAPIVHIGTFDWYTKSHITGTINNSVAKFKRIQSLVKIAKSEISILENVFKLSTSGKLFLFEKNNKGKIQMETACKAYINDYDIEKIASLFDCHKFTITGNTHNNHNNHDNNTTNHSKSDGSNHFAAIPSLLFYGRYQIHQRIIHNIKLLNHDFQKQHNQFYYKVETPNYYNDYDENINSTGAKCYYLKVCPGLRQKELKKRINELNQFCKETMIR